MPINYDATDTSPLIEDMRTDALGGYWSSFPEARVRLVTDVGNDVAYVPLKMPIATKTISGTVRENNVLCSRNVRCYRRSDGALARSADSNAVTGAFSFSGLDGSEQYFIVAFDADGDPNFNALVFDQVTPA